MLAPKPLPPEKTSSNNNKATTKTIGQAYVNKKYKGIHPPCILA